MIIGMLSFFVLFNFPILTQTWHHNLCTFLTSLSNCSADKCDQLSLGHRSRCEYKVSQFTHFAVEAILHTILLHLPMILLCFPIAFESFPHWIIYRCEYKASQCNNQQSPSSSSSHVTSSQLTLINDQLCANRGGGGKCLWRCCQDFAGSLFTWLKKSSNFQVW